MTDPETATQDLLTLVGRLEVVVRSETVALEQHNLTDLAGFTRKKSQMLLEVTRLTRLLKVPTGPSELNNRLLNLKTLLEVNRNALEVHLRAARQLTDIIAEAVQAAESDGTYSNSGGQGPFDQ